MALAKEVQQYFRKNVTFCTGAKALRKLKYYRRNPPTHVIHDTETNGLDVFGGNPRLWNRDGSYVRTDGAVAFCHVFGFYDTHNDHLWCVYVHREDQVSMRYAKWFLRNSGITKVGHNYKFDMHILRNSGIKYAGPYWDTMLAARFTHDRVPSHGLKPLGMLFSGRRGDDAWEKPVKKWLSNAKAKFTREENKRRATQGMLPLSKIPKWRKEHIQDEVVNYSMVPEDIMQEYALSDIWYTFLVWRRTAPNIEAHYQDLFDLEMDILQVVMDLEIRGVRIDRLKCIDAMQRLEQREVRLLASIQRECSKYGFDNFNPESPKQMIGLLKSLPIDQSQILKRKKNTKTGEYETKPSSDKEILEKLLVMYPQLTVLTSIMLYRNASKLRSTYFNNLFRKSKRDGIAHCEIRSSDTKNGRAASSNPNMQNTPNPLDPLRHPDRAQYMKNVPDVRSVFVPRDGFDTFQFDYSQIEMKMFAIFAQEKGMLEAIRNGTDLHDATARLMFPDYDEKPKTARKSSKTINFSIIYGSGVQKTATSLGVSYFEAQDLRNQYFDRLPGVKYLQDACTKQLWSVGYIEDMFGRRYHVETDKAYQAVNAVVQGASANVLKIAMLQVYRLIKMLGFEGRVNILLTIHDELDIEIHHSVPRWIVPLIKRTMETILDLEQYKVPMLVDIEKSNPDWGKKSDWVVRPEQIDSERIPRIKRKLSAKYKLQQEYTAQSNEVWKKVLDLDNLLWYNGRNVDWFLRKETP